MVICLLTYHSNSFKVAYFYLFKHLKSGTLEDNSIIMQELWRHEGATHVHSSMCVCKNTKRHVLCSYVVNQYIQYVILYTFGFKCDKSLLHHQVCNMTIVVPNRMDNTHFKNRQRHTHTHTESLQIQFQQRGHGQKQTPHYCVMELQATTISWPSQHS